ncbi:hypothetical protein Ciccas_002110 [Cichlidogyrus casuarinus]|uniref:Potassium channel domain-containing protein n=1 Tax=Cichlidogyrus casuarinus TaxID=1844966 RepID=A0ABD2QI46_9PLAT
MIYAVFGIPLMLLCLANLGSLFADIFRYLYVHCCSCDRPAGEAEPTMSAWKNINLRSTFRRSKQEQELVKSPEATNGKINSTGSTKKFQSQEPQLASIQEQPTDENAVDPSPSHAGVVYRKNVPITRNSGRASQYLSSISAAVELETQKLSEVNVPNWLTLTVLISYIMTGAVIYKFQEGWDLLNSIYFTFITLTTIGFGDIVPGSSKMEQRNPVVQAFAGLYLLVGLAMMAMCFNLMQDNVKGQIKELATKIGILNKKKPAQSFTAPRPPPALGK